VDPTPAAPAAGRRGIFALLALGLALGGLSASAGPPGEEPSRAAGQALSAAPIDAHFAARWRAAKVAPTASADAATFLRRVTLDLTGTIPSPAEVEAYLKSSRQDESSRGAERARRIDALLADPRRARHVARWASDRWIGALDELPQARPYLEDFRLWLGKAVASDRSWLEVAQRLVAAEGTTDREPALLYAVRHGRSGPEEFAGAAARDFLGLGLECARCHDHPFESWKQGEFHGLAAVFARTRLRPVRQGVLRVTEAPLGQHRYADPKGRSFTASVAYPGAALSPPRTRPTSRPASRPSGGLVKTTRTSRRVAFARWLGAPTNPWFARNVVNLTWERFFGRPLIQDGLTAASESPHHTLLSRLARDFVHSGYSLRSLERAIVTSRAYALSSTGSGAEALEKARGEFAAGAVRALSAPVLVEVLLRAGGRAEPRPGELPRLHARLRTRLIGELRRVLPDRPQAGEITPAEALWWLNGQAANGLTRGLALREAMQEKTPRARVRHLFLRTLARQPRTAEQRAALRHVKSLQGAPEAYADLFWALVSSTEFASNH
jgi:hypothetical protein